MPTTVSDVCVRHSILVIKRRSDPAPPNEDQTHVPSRLHPRPARLADRYLTVPCDADGCSDLAVIWDRLEEQVVDVINLSATAGYTVEDQLWDEARWTPGISDQDSWIPAMAA